LKSGIKEETHIAGWIAAMLVKNAQNTNKIKY
jgi:hypothetical protein